MSVVCQAGSSSPLKALPASPIKQVRQVAPIGLGANFLDGLYYVIAEVSGGYELAKTLGGPLIEERPGQPRIFPANRFRVMHSAAA